jgi:hypothetical protein
MSMRDALEIVFYLLTDFLHRKAGLTDEELKVITSKKKWSKRKRKRLSKEL